MYEEEFEIYNMVRDTGSTDQKTIQRNKKIRQRFEEMIIQMVAKIKADSMEAYKPDTETLEDLFKRVEYNDLVEYVINQHHIRKTHSLDLKIKQLEERIEYLESKTQS